MQRRVALWISGVFWTSPTLGFEAISRLIPIHLHLRKLYGRFLLWQLFLLSNHIINSLLSSNRMQEWKCHNASIDYLMAKQRLLLKSPLVDMDDKRNEFFPSFSFFNEEFKLESQLTDLFSDHFSFHSHSSDVERHIEKLDEIILWASSNLFLTIIVSDAGIKNYITTLISHIYSFSKTAIKTIHRAINITTTEAELFTIWCGINQAVANFNTNHIVVITDFLYAAGGSLTS